MPRQSETVRPRGIGHDLIWVCGFFVAGSLVYTAAVRAFSTHGGAPEFYQEEFGPAVLDACGRGFSRPPASAVPTALDDFLARRRQSLECADLDTSASTRPVDAFQAVHRNLMRLVTWTWRARGISWAALAWLSGILGGISLALGYLFFRLGMGRVGAAALTILWGMSPFQLGHLPHLRDYSKAPFFLLTICAIGWLVRFPISPLRVAAIMAIAGAMLGFGFGMRTDVVLYLPALVFALLVFRPGPVLPDLRTRALGAALAVAMFVIVARPVLGVYQSANNIAHVAILGLSDASNDWLQLNPAPYSFGYLHDDGFVATTVAAYENRAHASSSLVRVGTKPYERASNEYYGELARTFPADLLTRAWASVARVLSLPFLDEVAAPTSWMSTPMSRLYSWRAAMMSPFGGVIVILAAFLLAVGLIAWSSRLGTSFVLYLAGFAGICAIQFHGRNVFHLEILPVWIYGCSGSILVSAWRSPNRSVLRAAIFARLRYAIAAALALSFGITAPVWAARRYQTGTVRRLAHSYDSASLQPLPIGDDESRNAGRTLLRISSLSRTVPPPRAVLSDMLAIDVGGPSCDYDAVDLTFRYRAIAPFSDLSASRQIPVPTAEEPTARVFFPVYSLGSSFSGPRGLEFQGIEIPIDQRTCLTRVAAFREPERFPLLLETVLSPEWSRTRLYQTLRVLEGVDPFIPRAARVYAAPDTLHPGRKLRSTLVPVSAVPTYQSRIVSRDRQGRLIVSGTAESSGSYLVSWPAEARPGGSAFFVEGELLTGGLTVGTQQNERWLRHVNISAAGPFQVAVQVDAEGRYEAVIANHLLGGSLHNELTVSRVGWLPPANGAQ